MLGTPEQQRLGLDRLEILARGIRDPAKCGHKEFDFSQFNDSELPQCGTAGCMAGECPIFFPEDWMWHNNGYPILSKSGQLHRGLMEFFFLTNPEMQHLFIPYGQDPFYGGVMLNWGATRYQVSDNALEFIWREREKLAIEKNDLLATITGP